MPVTKRLQDLPKDLDRKISADFNELLQEIHTDLSDPNEMPVWTGFFASSWKIQGTPIIPTDKVENYEPWASIKREASLEFFRTGKSSRPEKPEINPRFPIGEEQRIFNYKKPVYIGNKAEYSIYALEGGKLQMFIQGSLGKMISETMTDKGKIFLGGSTTFNNSPKSTKTQRNPSIKYTEF